MKTALHPPYSSTYYSYNRWDDGESNLLVFVFFLNGTVHVCTSFSFPRVPWQLNIRKEVFSPTEAVRSPLAVHLIFCQVSSFSCPMLVYCRELPSAHVISQPDRVRRPLWRLLPPGPLRARQDEDAARRVRGRAWQRAGREAQVLFARKETQFHTKINFSRVLFQAQHEEEHHRHGKGVPALLRQVRIIYLFILFSPYNIVIFLFCATIP